MARETARELLRLLETGDTPVAPALMLAKRLARLLRDQDAQRWLDFESSGYTQGLVFKSLGSCEKYARACGRITNEEKYFPQSLPALEAAAKADELTLSGMRSPTAVTPSVENFTASGATNAVINNLAIKVEGQKNQYRLSHSRYHAIKSGIHSYAADVSLSLELGDLAESIFEAARVDVDKFVRANCPKAVEQLLAIADRMRESDKESLSAALTACRRILASVADALFPPRDEPYVDKSGKSRKVGTDFYKNRLMAYAESRMTSQSSLAILVGQLEHIGARLEAVYEKACKGVHADVTVEEARLTVIETYMFIAELARLGRGSGAG